MMVFVNAFAALVIGAYLYGQLDTTFLHVASNIIAPAAAIAATSYGLYLVSRYGFDHRNKFSRIWWAITIGLLLWSLGEITWSIYVLVLKVTVPYPSLGDTFWVAGYLPIMLSILSYVTAFKNKLTDRDVSIAIGITWVAAGVIYTVLIFPVLRSGTDPLTKFFDFAYPTLDIPLLALAFTGLLVFLRGEISRFWIWLNIGFIFVATADVLFSYATALGQYYDGHPLELLFHFGYLAILFGFYEQSRII
jgi:hypothetical protein